MLHTAARKILQTYVKERKILTAEELSIPTEVSQSKQLVFVTLYYNGVVIASSGRVHAKRENTATELIENTLACLQDLRFAKALASPDELENVQIRVDTRAPENRKIVNDAKTLDIRKHGVLFISQNLGTISVVLPNMVSTATNGEDLFFVVCKKAGVDMATLKSEDYYLYGIESSVYSDF